MLRTIKDLERLKIEAEDGNIGFVYDFYFDDVSWTTRYLVIDTGKWLVGRRVLVAPDSIKEPDFDKGLLSVNLKKEQIKNSPSISEDEPVSRQQEKVLMEYYGWPVYWTVDPALQAMVAMKEDQMKKGDENAGDPHLRSVREVRNYDVEVIDGDIGIIDSLVIDIRNWKIKYLIVDTRRWLHWLPGGKFVLISPEWINIIDYKQSKVYLDVDKEAVENIPDYEPDMEISQKFENMLYDCHKAFLNRKFEHTP
jgi:hypothetical protein